MLCASNQWLLYIIDSRGVRACVVSPTYCKTYGFYAVELSTILNKYCSVCDYWNYKYKIHLSFFCQSSCTPYSPKFFTTKIFYCAVTSLSTAQMHSYIIGKILSILGQGLIIIIYGNATVYIDMQLFQSQHMYW